MTDNLFDPPTKPLPILPEGDLGDQVGYITQLLGGKLVVGNCCSTNPPGGAKFLFGSDTCGYKQSCHMCGSPIISGSEPEMWESPLPSEERTTLNDIPIIEIDVELVEA